MDELYAEAAEYYDILYRQKDYRGEAEFMRRQIESRTSNPPEQVLVLGCGTGNHSKHFERFGYDVTAADRYERMVEIADEKLEGCVTTTTLPDIDVAGQYDAVVLPFTVINFLSRSDVKTLLSNIGGTLRNDGVLVFDNDDLLDFDGEHTDSYLETHAEEGVARLSQYHRTDGDALEQRSVIFAPDGEQVVNEYEVYQHADEDVARWCHDSGFETTTYDGYSDGSREVVGTESNLTVFVCQYA